MRVAGMDAVAYVRLLKYGWTVFAFATVVCCVVLLPVYGTGGVVGVLLQGGAETVSDLDVVSLSNVPSGSPRMVAQLLVLYIVAWFALLLLLWYSRDISRPRQQRRRGCCWGPWRRWRRRLREIPARVASRHRLRAPGARRRGPL